MSEDQAVVDRGDDLLAPDPAPSPEDDKKELDSGGTPDEEVASGGADSATDSSEETSDADKQQEEKPKGKRTANERIQELIRRNKDREAEYQARIKELEEATSRSKVSEDLQAAEAQLDELEEKYQQLMLDNNPKEAKLVRQQMRQMERAIIQQQTIQEAQRAKEMAKEEIRYDAAVSDIESRYPILNPDSEVFDDEVAAEVLDVHSGLVARGTPPSAAIRRAVKYVLADRGIDGKGEEVADEDEEDSTKARGLQRTKEAKTKNADAAKRQPASTLKVGADSDKLGGGLNEQSVLKMSQDDFAKLSEDALKKLRGDLI